MNGRHLTDDEIGERVFPSLDGPAPVPLHLAVCPDCQRRVGRLREAHLLDRGALDGAVEALPEEFWNAQLGSVMNRVHEPLAPVHPFPARLRSSLLRRPALALGSLAAAIVLVAGVTVMSTRTRGLAPRDAPVATVATVANVAAAASNGDQAALLAPADRTDDELLRSIDTALADESTLTVLIPEEI
jgi:hypothetical protein